MNSTLNQPMLITTNRIQTIIQSRGSITLSELEGILDASYNLIFLAIDYLSPENPCCLPNISHILGSLITYLKNSLMVKWPAERLKVSPACSWHIPLFLKPARSGSPSGSLTTSKFRPSDLPFPEFSLTLYQKHKSSLYAAFSASKTS